MTRLSRLVAVFVALLIPAVALFYWTALFQPGELNFDSSPLTNRMGPYELIKEEKLDPEIEARIEPELYLMQLYTDPDGVGIWLYVSFYGGFGSTGAHNPAVCYPAQGWDVGASRDLDLEMNDGDILKAHLIQARLDKRRELVLYWFQPAGRWQSRRFVEQVLRVYDGLRGKPQYAFVRLSMPTRADTLDSGALIEFARTVGPKVREIVETAAPR